MSYKEIWVNLFDHCPEMALYATINFKSPALCSQHSPPFVVGFVVAYGNWSEDLQDAVQGFKLATCFILDYHYPMGILYFGHISLPLHGWHLPFWRRSFVFVFFNHFVLSNLCTGHQGQAYLTMQPCFSECRKVMGNAFDIWIR
ncbi:hypothetical protein IFM89_028805 [Coptis chinensis]|uniref:Uncharacterized protein n=1 Tax=Coptis chinensis TaxID=261450 RepID=A0A835IDV3_9MAGN|nr:hypothetical protein IFM89_028805 [Coptis chinensis]